MRPVLGIETSCDETAAAVLDENGRVLAEAVLSQEREHASILVQHRRRRLVARGLDAQHRAHVRKSDLSSCPAE